jgi:uncharacterized protein YjbJ (UPF0337 family)
VGKQERHIDQRQKIWEALKMGSVEGKMDKGKGRVKEAAGDLTDNDSLKKEGRADRVGGSVKEKAGDAVDKVEETVDRVKDKLTRD